MEQVEEVAVRVARVRHHSTAPMNGSFSGTNKRTLMEVVQGYKYQYPGGVSTKVPFVPTKPEEGEEAPTTSGTAPASDPTTT